MVDYFIINHVIEVPDSDTDYAAQSEDKQSKRKSSETRYEGDPRFALPLMYVANLYETLVNDANIRIGSLNGIREKTIGVALEAAGGLYRRLAKKFPKKGEIFSSSGACLAMCILLDPKFPSKFNTCCYWFSLLISCDIEALTLLHVYRTLFVQAEGISNFS